MNNNDIQGITPITNTTFESIETTNSIQNNTQSQMQTPIINISTQEITDEFAHGLPDWDLVPPYMTVRRVNRK